MEINKDFMIKFKGGTCDSLAPNTFLVLCIVCTGLISGLRQHYVTLTTNCGFKKQNLPMHVHKSHKTAILLRVSQSHGLQSKLHSVALNDAMEAKECMAAK